MKAPPPPPSQAFLVSAELSTWSDWLQLFIGFPVRTLAFQPQAGLQQSQYREAQPLLPLVRRAGSLGPGTGGAPPEPLPPVAGPPVAEPPVPLPPVPLLARPSPVRPPVAPRRAGPP